jgi:hypothetical protein
MTFEQALARFKAEFPGWWWKVGECRISCDATIALDKHDVGRDGDHPDGDLVCYRTFDDGFEVDLPQPSTIVQALLHVMNKACIARQEFRAGTEVAAVMEKASEERRAKYGRRWSSSG